MKNKILSNLAIFLISSLLSIGIGEYLSRNFGLSKTWESYIASKKLSQGITKIKKGYIRTPNGSFVGPRNVSMIINSEGFRDKPFKKKGKKKRFAFIGDSVSEGFGVEVENRYSDRLASLYNNEIETLNFGIAGYTTIDELEVLKTKIIPLQPDVVILQVCFNDFADNLKQLSPKKEQFQSEVPETNINTFFQKYSALYLSIAERYNYLKLINGRATDLVPTQQSISEMEWQVFEKNIQAMASICRTNKITFILTYIPLEVETLLKDENISLIINNKIEMLSYSKGIPFINIIENFKKEEDLLSLYLDDCHLSKSGNLLVAELMKEYLNRTLYNKK